jgi:hypothetical protein
MSVKLRPGTREDAEACGVIDFEAFKSVSSQHNFPWDFPSVEIAIAFVTMMLSNPGFLFRGCGAGRQSRRQQLSR